MKTNKVVRLLLLGFLIWLVPFIASFAFFDRSGKPMINYDLFKSIMIVISSLVGSYAIIRYFRNIGGGFVKEAVVTGGVWLAMNLALDLIILVPFANMRYAEYFSSIGLRYLQIPIICLMAGVLLEHKLVSENQ